MAVAWLAGRRRQPNPARIRRLLPAADRSASPRRGQVHDVDRLDRLARPTSSASRGRDALAPQPGPYRPCAVAEVGIDPAWLRCGNSAPGTCACAPGGDVGRRAARLDNPNDPFAGSRSPPGSRHARGRPGRAACGGRRTGGRHGAGGGGRTDRRWVAWVCRRPRPALGRADRGREIRVAVPNARANHRRWNSYRGTIGLERGGPMDPAWAGGLTASRDCPTVRARCGTRARLGCRRRLPGGP